MLSPPSNAQKTEVLLENHGRPHCDLHNKGSRHGGGLGSAEGLGSESEGVAFSIIAGASRGGFYWGCKGRSLNSVDGESESGIELGFGSGREGSVDGVGSGW